MLDGYVTVKEISAKWNLKARTVQMMCSEGKLAGAVKFGRDWAIPAGMEKPIDKRVTSGLYKKN